MPNRLYIAVQSPDENAVRIAVDEFFGSLVARLPVYPLEISYDLIEIRRAADGRAGLDPVVEHDILQVFAKKDAEIAHNLHLMSPHISKSEQVVAALSSSEDIDALLREIWSEGFSTKGKSLSAHYVGHDHDADWARAEFRRALTLMDGGFHEKVGFWDLETFDPSLHALRYRVKIAPEAQWVATIDMGLGGSAPTAKDKAQKRLESTIDDLAEYIRDLCIKHHDAPFEACAECAAVLEAAESAIATDP